MKPWNQDNYRNPRSGFAHSLESNTYLERVHLLEWAISVAADSELDGWKQRLKDINLRLLRPKGLTAQEKAKLRAEITAFEKLIRDRRGG